jgi:eukaryotic-like serine/threonine-protein kinase
VIQFLNKLINFLKSKTFLINLGLSLTVAVAIVIGTMSYLDSFTRHGQQFEVPDLVKDKVNIADIDLYLEGKSVTYEILDSVYRTDLPSGTIFFQEPGPTAATGTFVKEGRKIKVRVATRFQLVEMPDLAGKTSRRFAEQKLKNRGLIAVIELKPSTEGRDQVLEQKYKGKPINGGEKVPVGSKIVLIVSQGATNEMTEIPNLIGLTISQANQRLSEYNLNAYTLCDDCLENDNNDDAVIYKQSPESNENETIAAGSTVTIWASRPQ